MKLGRIWSEFERITIFSYQRSRSKEAPSGGLEALEVTMSSCVSVWQKSAFFVHSVLFLSTVYNSLSPFKTEGQKQKVHFISLSGFQVERNWVNLFPLASESNYLLFPPSAPDDPEPPPLYCVTGRKYRIDFNFNFTPSRCQLSPRQRLSVQFAKYIRQQSLPLVCGIFVFPGLYSA